MRNDSMYLSRLLPAIAILLVVPILTSAQTSNISPRITAAIDETKLTTLKGNTHPLARSAFDRGAAPDSLPMQRMLLVLKRGADQEAALDQLMEQQQDASSPNFHKWLTPAQFGLQFGPSDQDIQTIAAWLQSHGFQIAKVSNGRTVIEFSGTAGQVQEAFHTAIHKYNVNGEEHWANSSAPQIPAALASVVAGINTLYNFPREQLHRVAGVFSRAKATGAISRTGTQFTFPNPCNLTSQPFCNFAVAPADFAKIYDVPNLLLTPAPTTKFNGDGVTIAIVSQSEIVAKDISDFRTLFGLPAPTLNVIVNGPDPGLDPGGAETEADLDVQWAGAVAPNATIDLVVSQSTEASLGADLSAQFAVDNNLAPILNESFGLCEFFLGTAGNAFYNQLWQQAAAQGITVTVSSGDSGAAGCNRGPGPATFGLAVSGFTSTPYNVSVGGTDFNDINNFATFWNTTPSDTPTVPSALGYIPEMTWNDTCTNQEVFSFFGATTAEQACNNAAAQNNGLLAVVGGSGGTSSCTTSDGQNESSCRGGYAKPSWQTALTPTDGKRDVPDVSLFASDGFNGSFYLVCEADFPGASPGATSCDPYAVQSDALAVGGTSASSPAFAGIIALVNQATGLRQGNANYILYKLAAQTGASCTSAANPAGTCVFYDVPGGSTIAMPCTAASLNCSTTTAGDQYGVLSGYPTTAGYDLATGLGSVNAANLISKWEAFALTLKPSSTTLTLNSGKPVNITHGQSVGINVGVTGTGGPPTGSVSLVANTAPPSAPSEVTEQGVQSFVLSGGSASGNTTALPGGSYTVVAQYAGDGTFGSSTSTPPVSVTVAKEASKAQLAYELFDPNTGLQTNPNATTAVFGTPAVLRINVTSQASDACPQNSPGSTGCPTGTVTLTDSYNGGTGTPLDGGGFPLNVQGYAEDRAIDLPGGVHNLTATYGGDSSYTAPANPTTETLTITPAITTTSVSANPTSTTLGSAVNLFANMSAQNIYSNHAPTGTVTFFSGGTQVASATLSGSTSVPTSQASGFASASTTSLPHGQDSITAKYSGDASYAASTSTATTVTVLYSSTIATTFTPSNIVLGDSVTFTITIGTGQPASNAAVKPTGTISYVFDIESLSGSVPATAAQDASGNWVLQGTVTIKPQQDDFITVNYSGDSNYAPSSAPTYVPVTIPDFSLSAGSAPLIITAGQTGTVTMTITPTTNYTSTVTLSCNGVVAGAPCSFSPSSVTLSNGASATSILSLSVPAPSTNLTAMASPRVKDIGPLAASNRSSWWAFASAASVFSSVLLLISQVRRRSLRNLLGLVFIAAAAFAIGCGGGGSGGGGGGGGGGGAGGGGGGGPAVTTTSLASSSGKILQGGSATLTATVTSSKPLTGLVNFNDLTLPDYAPYVSVVNGTAQAQLTDTGLPIGTHAINAVYLGDPNNLSSQSGSINIVLTGTTTLSVVGQTSADVHAAQLNVTVQ